MVRRPDEMWTVGYFLSKFGAKTEGRSPSPPAKLQVKEWNRAYAMFYRSLGSGRTLRSFANSLKNARDSFDAHLSSGRVGWRVDGEMREPAELPNSAEKVIRLWGERNESEIWDEIAKYADMDVAEVSENVLSDLFAEIEFDAHQIFVRTEGGRHAVISTRIERDPALRNAAMRLHGTRCQVCGFDFEEKYGSWGRGFAIVHHLRMLAEDNASERETNPRTDLAVLCANCHCMVHRRRHVVLTVEELSVKLT